jgi:hypothetical protein
MNQRVCIQAPIRIINSGLYLLVIEDANGIRHYFHKEYYDQKNDYYVEEGEYDGWSY